MRPNRAWIDVERQLKLESSLFESQGKTTRATEGLDQGRADSIGHRLGVYQAALTPAS